MVDTIPVEAEEVEPKPERPTIIKISHTLGSMECVSPQLTHFVMKFFARLIPPEPTEDGNDG